MAAPPACYLDWSRILIGPRYLGIEKAPKRSMESTSQTGLHKETQGREVTTERRSGKTTSEPVRKTNEANRWKQPQRGARQAAPLKRASIQRNSPEIRPAELPDGCPPVPYMRAYKEPGRDAIKFESQEHAAMFGVWRDLDEWPRLARRLESKDECSTTWDFEHLRHMVEIRRRIQAIGRSSRPNAKSNPSS